MNETRPGLVLKVVEAPESDVGTGRARVDEEARLALGVDVGEAVEMVGRRTTAAKLFSVMQKDEGQGIIRVDGLVRRNLGVSIGDKVEVRKAEILPAERVTIAPIMSEGHMISFGQGMENFVKRGLLKRPVTNGDVVIVPGIALMGGALRFMVIKVTPEGIVQIVDDTIVEMKEEPVRESEVPLENLSPEDIYAEFVRLLKRGAVPALAYFAVTLAKLPGPKGDKARELAAAISRLLADAESDSEKQGP